jgi:RNA polymerase sigma factor (TIGR02999 family)
MADVTELLHRWSTGDRAALEALVPLVYAELARIASRLLRSERADHTLETRALVHEAYLRLVRDSNPQWDGRTHFFGAAANVMRRVLVDEARRRLSAKRGSGVQHDDHERAIAVATAPDTNVIELDDALDALAAVDPERARVVELRYFAGLTLEETAATLRVSPQTVSRDWAVARAWLARHLQRAEVDGSRTRGSES